MPPPRRVSMLSLHAGHTLGSQNRLESWREPWGHQQAPFQNKSWTACLLGIGELPGSHDGPLEPQAHLLTPHLLAILAVMCQYANTYHPLQSLPTPISCTLFFYSWYVLPLKRLCTLFLFVVFLPRSLPPGSSFGSWVCSKCSKQKLACSRHSISVCGMSEWTSSLQLPSTACGRQACSGILSISQSYPVLFPWCPSLLLCSQITETFIFS